MNNNSLSIELFGSPYRIKVVDNKCLFIDVYSRSYPEGLIPDTLLRRYRVGHAISERDMDTLDRLYAFMCEKSHLEFELDIVYSIEGYVLKSKTYHDVFIIKGGKQAIRSNTQAKVYKQWKLMEKLSK